MAMTTSATDDGEKVCDDDGHGGYDDHCDHEHYFVSMLMSAAKSLMTSHL